MTDGPAVEDGGQHAGISPLRTVRNVAECGYALLAAELLRSLDGPFLHGLAAHLVEALELCDPVLRDHVPSFQPDPAPRKRM